MDERSDLVLGQIVAGRYEIRRLVGEGGMGSVYLARDRNLGGRQVAIKALNPEYVGRRDRERRFENEALFSALSGRLPYHTNLAATLDSGRIDGTRPFIVMEYVDGPAISGLRVVEGRALTAEEVCTLARGVASALRVIHEAGLVHRDLTPTNVLVATIGGEWVPKVIDLSHAASISGPKLQLGHPKRLTQPNEIPGTAGYMSPEQVDSRYPTPAMDIFSFGVMLWEVLADRDAYRERDREPYCELQRESPRPPPPLVDHRPDLPKSLYRLVEHCTRTEAKERPNAQEVLDQLEVVALELNTPGIGVANEGPPRFAHGVPVDVPARPRREVARLGKAAEVPAVVGAPGDYGGSPVAFDHEHATTAPVAAAVPTTSQTRAASEPIPSEGGGEPGRRWPILVVVFLLVMATVAALGWLWLRGSRENQAANPSAPVTEVAEAADVSRTGAEQEPLDQAAIPRGVEPEPDRSAPEEPTADEPERQPDAGPKPEDELVEAEPTAKPRPQGRRKRKSSPTPPPCTDVTEEARVAVRGRRWGRVLELTKSPRCWDDAALRLELRVRALRERGRYAECVRLAESSTAPEIKRLSKPCFEKLANEDSP